MKVLVFTHISDIDGMGGAVLAKLAFDEVDYVLCETFHLQKEIAKYYENKTIYDYDKVFVTDLWLEEPMLTKVANDKKLKDKFFVFDHHDSALKEGFDKYPFTTVRIKDEKGKCSGTTLFYEYLVKQKWIDKDNIAIEEFCELTRRYDTWKWKTIYNDETAHELSILFDSVGCDSYIELMYTKLNQKEKKKHFSFSELERMLIQNKIKQNHEKCVNYSKKIYYKKLFGYKVGIIFIDYEYRNDLAQYLRDQNFDIDFVMLISLDYGTISYRNVKANVKVRLVAEKLGGKGHDYAASSPISDKQKNKLVKIVTRKKRRNILELLHK